MADKSNMSTFKKIGLFGIGTFAIAQDKIEEFTQEMIKKGEATKEEGKMVVANVLFEKNRQIEYVEYKIDKSIKDIIELSGIATKEDIDAINKRLEMLGDKIEKMVEIEEH